MIKNELIMQICAALDGKKASDIVVIDVQEMTPITDYIITCTGRTSAQLKAMCDEVEEKVKKNLSVMPTRIDGYSEGRWIVLDYNSALVHIFCDEFRSLYQLEQLWSNGDNVEKYEAPVAEREDNGAVST